MPMHGGNHVPTEKTRAVAKALKAYQRTNPQIAQYLEISEDTLEKHYKQELLTATSDLIHKAGNVIADKIEKGDKQAAMFALKTRGGWRETDTKDIEQNTKQINELQQRIDAILAAKQEVHKY